MADRSDDIKQLFSHLGLNPGDYQEMRESSAVTRRETLAATLARTQVAPAVTPIVAPAPAPAPAAAAPPPPPITAAPPQAAPAPALPPAPTVMAAAAPAMPRLQAPTLAPPLPGFEAATRWPLLRAAVETPTRVAQIDRAEVPAETTPQLIVPAVVEDAPTRRLFQELSRRPVDEAVDQLAEAARRRWQQAPATPSPAPPPPLVSPPWEAPSAQIQAPPAPAAPSPTPVRAEPAPAQQPGDAAVAKGELLSTFRRLVAPERVPEQRPARLHFNYSADASAPRPKQPREENLDDVFSRISDPRHAR